MKQRKHQAKRPAFSPNQIKQITEALKDFEQTGRKQRTRDIRALLRDYVHFLIMTGARPGTELKYLRYSDIERFTRDGAVYLLIKVDGKAGERSLVAPFSLARYIDRLQRRNKPNSEYMFRLPDGSYPKDLHRAFQILLEQLDLTHDCRGKRYSLYSLRHT